jgi:hypothetical protein
VNVSKRWWVCDDQIRNEWGFSKARRLLTGFVLHFVNAVTSSDARHPAATQYTTYRFLLHLDRIPTHGAHLGYDAWISNHVRHQLSRVSRDIEELQSKILNKLLEYGMGCEAHSVSRALKFESKCYKGLHVASRTHYLQDNIESRARVFDIGGSNAWFFTEMLMDSLVRILKLMLRNARNHSRQSCNIEVDSAIHFVHSYIKGKFDLERMSWEET